MKTKRYQPGYYLLTLPSGKQISVVNWRTVSGGDCTTTNEWDMYLGDCGPDCNTSEDAWLWTAYSLKNAKYLAVSPTQQKYWGLA